MLILILVRDTGQHESPVHAGEIGTGLAPIDFMLNDNSPEEEYGSVTDWYKKELEHWKVITPFNGKEARTLSHYLSTHEETPIEKKFGDRYGRYILGWDAKKKEPIIGYRFSYVPLELLKHNMAEVPDDYATSDWYIGLNNLVFGDAMIIPGLPDEDDDELPL